MIRVLCCLVLFGWGAEALHGGTAGVLTAGVVALGVNLLWKREAALMAADDRRKAIIEQEDLRLEVRQRRSRP